MTVNSNYLYKDASFEQNLQVLSTGQLYSKEAIDAKEALSHYHYGLRTFGCIVLGVAVIASSILGGHYFNPYAYSGVAFILIPAALIYLFRRRVRAMETHLIEKRAELRAFYFNFISEINKILKQVQNELIKEINKEEQVKLDEKREDSDLETLLSLIQTAVEKIKEDKKTLFELACKTASQFNLHLPKLQAELNNTDLFNMRDMLDLFSYRSPPESPLPHIWARLNALIKFEERGEPIDLIRRQNKDKTIRKWDAAPYEGKEPEGLTYLQILRKCNLANKRDRTAEEDQQLNVIEQLLKLSPFKIRRDIFTRS